MALTEKEFQDASIVIDYYSGRFPDVPVDLTKSRALIQGDEVQVRAALDTFATEIKRPQIIKNINQLQASLSQQQAELEAIDTQISR